MTAKDDARLDELQSVVTELGRALAASERRSLRLERTVRWGVMGALAALGIGVAVMFQPFGRAVAQTAGTAAPSQSVEQALDRINQSLGVFNMMGMLMQAGMQSAVEESVQAIDTGDNISPLYQLAYDSIAAKLKQEGVPPEEITLKKIQAVPDSQKAMIIQGALMTATGSVLVDAGVLMHRVREDSDLFRSAVQSIGGPNKLLAGIQQELHLMNGMLASIPVMAGEMNTMTHQMGVMSYSVGNTMGRAGSWMPW